MLIGVAGKARSGKDLLYSFAAKDGYAKLSFAVALKQKVRSEFDLTTDHTDGNLKEVQLESLDWHSPRELMIDIGNMYRKYDSNYWIRPVLDIVKSNPQQNIMITDVRYQNEANEIRNHGGLLIRLERPESRARLVSEETNQSLSETSLDNYKKWNFVLEAKDNETPEQLATFWNVVSASLRMKL